MAIAVLIAAGFFWLRHTAAPRPGDGPIILISIDTLRADHLPVYGYRKVDTPSIDALAHEGVVFDHAYAHSPQTLPSHTSILSGQLPFETGVRDNIGFTVRKDLPLLAELAHSKGFATGGVVSAFVLRKETGIDRGFDFYDSQMPPAAPDEPMGQVQRPGIESLAVAEHWMDGVQSPRFFLFFHIYEPHTPYRPPSRFSRYAPYDGEIAYSDEIIGKLFDYLKRRGWYDRANIILLSDHGEGLGDHGELEHGLFLYDSTIRVPFIIKMPGGQWGGRRVAQPVQHIDLVPTVLDWLGIPRAAALHGHTLRPLIEGHGSTATNGSYAESFYGRYHFGWSELYSLTDDRFKFIKAPHAELYDMQNDGGETHNLAAERPQIATAARTALDHLLAGTRIDAPGAVSKEDLERMQALGYVGTQATVPADKPGESLPDPKDKAQILEKYRQASERSAARDYARSIDLLREVLADSPMMKDCWQQLGEELVRAGRLPEALEAFRHLVEIDPADGNSFVNAGGILFTLGRYDEAQANAEMALSKAPATDRRARTSACELLVKVAMARKDYAAARRAAALSQQADPDFPLPPFVEGVILHDSHAFDQAAVQFESAAQQVQGHAFVIPELFYYLGDTLANLGREQEAAAAFRSEIKVFPTNVRARASLAMLYRAGGNAAAASEEIDRLLRDVPTPDGYAMAAKTWSIFGEPARAAVVRAEAKKRFGPNAK